MSKHKICLTITSDKLFDEISQAAIAHEVTICEELRHIIEDALKLEKRRKQNRECKQKSRKLAAEVCGHSADSMLTKETEERKETEKEENPPHTPSKEKEGENKKEEKEKTSLSSPSRARTCERSGKRMVSERFAKFWAAYPERKRTYKSAALSEYTTIFHDPRLTDEDADKIEAAILAGLEKWKVCEEWTKDGGNYITYPKNFLRNRLWEEEPPKPDAPLDPQKQRPRERVITPVYKHGANWLGTKSEDIENVF